MSRGLNPEQIQQFHKDGFLIGRDLLPREALQPLIDELEQKVDDLTNDAVRQELLDATDIFSDAPFDTRLALVSEACSEHNWLWRQFGTKQHKTAGMFTLRTWPALLDVAESLIGPRNSGASANSATCETTGPGGNGGALASGPGLPDT